MTETPDTVDPTLTSAQIDYGSGIITFDADETLDFTPVTDQGYENYNTSLIYISNSIGEYGINIDTAKVTTSVDSIQFFVRLDEADRVAALRISSTPGGDEGGVLLRPIGNNIPSLFMPPSPIMRAFHIREGPEEASATTEQSANIVPGTITRRSKSSATGTW